MSRFGIVSLLQAPVWFLFPGRTTLAFDRFDGHGKRERKQPAKDTTTRLRLNVAPALGYLGAVPQRATGAAVSV
jgi:hypothetical protein